MSVSFHDFTVTGFCRICQLCFSHLHQFILSTSNLRTLMSVSFHHFTVTGCCRIWFFLWRGKSRFVELGVSNLFSFCTIYLKLESFDAMPGLLVFHVHHTLCNFRSDWLLQDLPIFTFQPGVGSWCSLRQFCIKRNARATCFPCPPYIFSFHSDWLLQDLPTFFVFGVYPKLENFGVCQCSSSKHDKTQQDLIFFGGVRQDL